MKYSRCLAFALALCIPAVPVGTVVPDVGSHAHAAAPTYAPCSDLYWEMLNAVATDEYWEDIIDQGFPWPPGTHQQHNIAHAAMLAAVADCNHCLG